MKTEFIEELKKKAKRRCWVDKMNEPNNDCYVMDFCGGNVDDAYSGGCEDGEALLARDVLKQIGVEF